MIDNSGVDKQKIRVYYKRASKLFRGGGALPYMDYIGMCRCEGMVFKQFTLG